MLLIFVCRSCGGFVKFVFVGCAYLFCVCVFCVFDFFGEFRFIRDFSIFVSITLGFFSRSALKKFCSKRSMKRKAPHGL